MTLLQVLTAYSPWAPAITAGLIVLDALIGVLRALGTGSFSWAKLPQFAEKQIVPKLGSVVLVTIVQYFTSHGSAVWTIPMAVVWGGVVIALNLALLRDILDKLGWKIPLPAPPATGAQGKG